MTLTGPGGIGKTSLALKAARGVVGDFAYGGWLVELAQLSGSLSRANGGNGGAQIAAPGPPTSRPKPSRMPSGTKSCCWS